MNPYRTLNGWSRREFLTLLGAAGLIRPVSLLADNTLVTDAIIPPGTLVGGPRFRVLRARDLLSLELELLNLEVVQTRERREIQLISHAADGFLILHFPGQHIAEQAIWDRGGQKNPDGSPTGQNLLQKDAPAPVTYRLWKMPSDPKSGGAKDPGDTDEAFLQRITPNANKPRPDGATRTRLDDPDALHGLAGAWISGPTQLVFVVPQRRTPLPFDLDEILRLCAEELKLVVAPGVAALTGDENDSARLLSQVDGQSEPVVGYHPGGVHDPLNVPYSVVEFPALLNLSPYQSARWRVRPAPADGHSELWGFELEPPDTSPLTGRPRTVQPRGHLFAFGWRSSDEARWPLPQHQPLPAAPVDPAHKYSPIERPKTSLYEATRKLLVNQLLDDNGDILARRLRLSALGATARLHYNPALEVPDDQNLEGAKPRDGTTPPDEGILTEWEQKTETGRDFYSKESFSGYWMPYGFKGEVVTITERLLCSPNDPPQPVSSVRPAPEQPAPDDRLIDLREDESQLTAFLVARKFGRFRGSRVRTFASAESADFSDLAGQAGRAIGLRQVEVLVERTPILANQAASSPTDADALRHISAGEDAIVDGGAGADAAREIFWPRVQDFIVDETGRRVRRLVVYKFPIRLTFLDGSTRDTELPMLFVPTLRQGEALYPNALVDLRAAPIGAKVAIVTPPPVAAVAGADLGAPDQVARISTHLTQFLPNAFKPLAAAGNITASVSSALAEGVNLVLGKIPDEISRRVTQRSVTSVLQSLAGQGDVPFRAQVSLLLQAGLQPSAKSVDAVLADVTKAMAWGEQLTDTIDATQAAERLNLLLTHAGDSAASLQPFSQVLAPLRAGLSSLHNLPAPSAATLNQDLDTLGSSQADPVKYRKAMRQLLVHWAVLLGASWRRSDWDTAFQTVAATVDRAVQAANELPLVVQARVASLRKELQLALLRGGKGITITAPLPDPAHPGQIISTAVAINPPDLPAGMTPAVLEQGIQNAVHQVLASLETLAQSQVATLEHILDGLAAAIAEEQALAARLRWLIQDYPQLEAAALRTRIHEVLVDVETHLAFALTHFEDGRARWERFLQAALTGEELIRQARTATLDAWRTVQDAVTGKVKDAITNIDSTTAKVQDSVQRLLMVTNPDQLQQRFQDFAALTGGRLLDDLRDKFSGSQSRAVQLLQNLDAFRKAPTTSAAQVRQRLDELFGLARNSVERYRGMLEKLLTKSQDQVTTALQNASAGVAQAEKLVNSYILIASNKTGGDMTQVSWQIGAAARDLLDAVQTALAVAQGSVSTTDQALTGDLKALCAALDQQLRTDSAVAQSTLNALQSQFDALSARLEADLGARITAFKSVLQEWLSVPKKRVSDALDHLAAILWALLQQSEEKFRAVVGALLANLGEDALQLALAKFPLAAQAAADLRHLTGEVEDITGRIEQLPSAIQAQARALQQKLSDQAVALGNALSTGLKSRLEYVEGDLLSMAKRAGISLPSPALMAAFQDQTRKAIFQTSQFLFSVQTIGGGVRSFLAHPRLESISAVIPHVDGTQLINYANDYLAKGLRDADRAANEVFANLAGAANTAIQNSGIAQVGAQVQALSREAGNLAATAQQQLAQIENQVQGALQNLRDNAQASLEALTADAKNQLQSAVSDLLPGDLQLFNKIPLTQLLQVIGSPAQLPKMLAHEFPDRIERTFSFSQTVQPVNLVIVSFTPAKSGCRFQFNSRAILWLPGSGRAPRPPSVSVRGQLDPFAIEIASLLRVNFVSLSFVSENGNFNCVPKLGKVPDGGGGRIDQDTIVEFLGPLAFVDDLRKTIGKLLADKGLVLGIADDCIFAGLRIALPDITLGAVAVTNLALNMGLGLPLAKGPIRYRFAISDRVNTFRVAVTIFAGGGFFALELASQPELCKVEVAIEFGGSLSLNLGIASGSLSVMAGIYFSWSGNATILDAYLRACGNVVVLGFIEVSIVFYLALGYRKEGQNTELHGEASITISVKIGFFSKSFSLSYEKTIAGSQTRDAFYDLPGDRIHERTRRLASRTRHLCDELPNTASTEAPPHVAPRFSEAMSGDDFLVYWRAFDETLFYPCT